MAFGADERGMLLGDYEGDEIFTILSYDKITKEIIDYWEKRLRQSKNPVIKARYASLIWDQAKIVTGEKPNYQFAQNAIDSILELAISNRHSSIVSVILKLENAMYLAILLNDRERIEKTRDCIISYEDKIAKDDMLGTWGFSFDIFWENKKVILDDKQWEKLIKDLEERLQRVSGKLDPSKKHPFAAEAASRRLALFYRGKKNSGDIKRVLDISAENFKTIGESASPMLFLSWMQKMHSVYEEFGLAKEAEEISKSIRQIGPKVLLDLKQISSEYHFPKEKIDQAIDLLIEGGIDNALSKIALYFIPNKQQIEDQIKNVSKLAPISFLFSTSLLDHEGRVVSTIAPLEEDHDANLVLQIAENMNFLGILLNIALERAKEKYKITEKNYIDYLFQSPVFLNESKMVIELGLREYIAGNYINAIHLLIPQIECGFRNLLQIAGGVVLKRSRYGGWDMKLLHEILDDPGITQIFDQSNPGTTRYFKTLLTDPRGWNLRNAICHGFINFSSLGKIQTDRIVHALLCMAQVKEKK